MAVDLTDAYDALRAADAAGNTEDARRLADYIASVDKTAPPALEAKPDEPNAVVEFAKNAVGTYEPLLTMATGAVAAPVAGLAGIAQGLFGDEDKSAADVVRNVQSAMTYQPRTRTGQAVQEAISIPGEIINKGTTWAAEHATDAATSAGMSPEVAGAIGAAVQSLPTVAGLAAGAKIGSNAAKAGAVAERTAAADVINQAATLAQDSGLDWNALGRTARAKIVDAVKSSMTSKSPANLDPTAVRRIARAEKLPVKVELTEGQATRSPSQLRTEENLAQLDVGTPIRERHMQQDAALQDSLSVLRGRTGSRAQNAEQAGKTLDAALRTQERKSLGQVDKLYNKARKLGETDEQVDGSGLVDFISNHERPEYTDAMVKQMKRQGVLGVDEDGNLALLRNPTINELELARKPLVRTARMSADGEARHYAGQLVGQIDKAIPDTAGGAAYKAARTARKEHAKTFEEPKAVAQVVTDKNSADRTVALENVWRKTVVNGDVSGLERIRKQLLGPGDRRMRDQGRKAWRDMVGQTVQHIKDRASVGAKNQNDVANLSPAALKAAIKEIGPRKLEILLGKSTFSDLQNLVAVAEDVKTMPPYKGGATTAINAATFAEKVFGVLDKASHIPIIGHAVPANSIRGAARLLREGAARSAQDVEVQRALGARPKVTPPKVFTLREQAMAGAATGAELAGNATK